MRKEITIQKYKILVWGTIFSGLMIDTIAILLKNIYWASTGALVTGFGMGLAYARSWFIKGIDDMKNKGNNGA
jgi:hypothetical protein